MIQRSGAHYAHAGKSFAHGKESARTELSTNKALLQTVRAEVIQRLRAELIEGTHGSPFLDGERGES